MVVFLYALLIPFYLFSAEFLAEVSRNPTPFNEGFTLSLILKNGVAKGAPQFDSLKDSFFIHSQQQSYSNVINNGKASSNTTWQFTLLPKKEGELMIPSIVINTESGLLSTNPIKLRVTAQNSAKEDNDIAIKVHVSSDKPYKNETFLYSIRLLSKYNINNISLENFSIENAIVEPAEKPKVDSEIIDGVKFFVVEFNYLITPLSQGALEIPSLTLQGEIPVKNRPTRDFFSLMHVFDQVKPFMMKIEALHLEVAGPIEGINPWIAGNSLKIKEIWNQGPISVNEPFTRSFEIIGEGIVSAQLPDLLSHQTESQQFKVYADTPELKDEILNGKIHSLRKESYTLIPQKEGELFLPEIAVEWWDVKNHKKAVSKIEARMISVNPSKHQISQPIEKLPEENKESNSSPLFYVLIGSLTTFLAIGLFFGIAIAIRKYRSLPKKLKPIKPSKQKKEKLPDLNPT